jgi:nucleotide-binding universal stress UspA family protein
MYTSILVPLDGSSFSEHALPLALSVARSSGAMLQLAHVHVDDAHRTNDGTLDAQQRARERAYLASVADRLATGWHGPTETTLLDGPVAEAIAAYAESHHIDLVVMTTHGRGALSRAWLGSVTDRLVRQLPMPMLLVRPHETDPADITNPPSIKHVLIPLDGSDMSERIIPHALALGRLTCSRYTLVQTLELLMTGYGLATYAPAEYEIDALMQEAQQYLDRVAAGLRAEGLQVQTEVFFGPPAMTILDYAREHAVDLIALETHGRSGAARLFLGSVADKIVRGAGEPILLRRPQDAATTP